MTDPIDAADEDELRRRLNPWRSELHPVAAADEFIVLTQIRGDGYQRYLGDLVGRGVLSLVEASRLLAAPQAEANSLAEVIVRRWRASVDAAIKAGVRYPWG